MINFMRTIYLEMLHGNFSFLILVVGIWQLIEMKRRR